MSPNDKPLVWLAGEVKSPPLSASARLEVGFLLRKLQAGEFLELPHARPMPSIGPRCHELRVQDQTDTWRIVVRVDKDALVLLEVFSKKTQKTPAAVIRTCQQRLKAYDAAKRGE